MYLWNVGEPAHVERARKRVAIAAKNAEVEKREVDREERLRFRVGSVP